MVDSEALSKYEIKAHLSKLRLRAALRARKAVVAIYHLSVKAVSRSSGRSAPAAAAYRTGERIVNERDGVTHDYSRRTGVEQSFIVAPPGAKWAHDRSQLWNAAEAAENRKNSLVAREYEVALPAELSAKGRTDLARDFAAELVERYGVAADVAIHAPGKEGDSRNHHAHILTTTRTVGADGLGPKTRVLDDPKSGEIERIREVWAGLTNRALERDGVGERVDHRSLAARREAALEVVQNQARPEPERQAAERQAQDLDREPTVHLGPAAVAIERRGEGSERGDQMRAVQGRNEERRGLWQQVREWGGQALDKARDLGTQLRERLSGADLTLLRNANLRASLARADLSGLREVNKTLEQERAPKQTKLGLGLDLPGKIPLSPMQLLTKGSKQQQGQAAPGPKISLDDGAERSRSERRSQGHRQGKSKDYGWER
jgi:hypothetical protein